MDMLDQAEAMKSDEAMRHCAQQNTTKELES